MILSLCLAFAGETINGSRIVLELQGVEDRGCGCSLQWFKGDTGVVLDEDMEMEACSESPTLDVHVGRTHTRFAANFWSRAALLFPLAVSICRGAEILAQCEWKVLF